MSTISLQKFDQKLVESFSHQHLLGNGVFQFACVLDEKKADDESFGHALLSSQPKPIPFHPFYTVIEVGGKEISTQHVEPYLHNQSINMDLGLFTRQSTFHIEQGHLHIESNRFIHQIRPNFSMASYTFSTSTPMDIDFYTGIIESDDQAFIKILDMPRPSESQCFEFEKVMEPNSMLQIAETISTSFKNHYEVISKNGKYLRHYHFKTTAGRTYTIFKYVAVVFSNEKVLNLQEELNKEKDLGYSYLLKENKSFWKQKWDDAYLKITGNDTLQEKAQEELYRAIISRPVTDDFVYLQLLSEDKTLYDQNTWESLYLKFPFYLNTDLLSSKNILMYYIKQCYQALENAKNLGYHGAFYQTQMGELVVKKHPQIFMGALISHLLNEYIQRTKDYSVFIEGGLEMLYEISSFYLHYSSVNKKKNRYEFWNVTGPDVSHQGVNNDVFTNYSILNHLEFFFDSFVMARSIDAPFVRAFEAERKEEIKKILVMKQRFYLPRPNRRDVIEQFDGYFDLLDGEKITPDTEISKTQIVSSGSVILTMLMFHTLFSESVMKSCFEYYLPRTQMNPIAELIYSISSIKIKEFDFAQDTLTKNLASGIQTNFLYKLIVEGFCQLLIDQGIVMADFTLPKTFSGVVFHLFVGVNQAMITVRRSSVKVKWNIDSVDHFEEGIDLLEESNNETDFEED